MKVKIPWDQERPGKFSLREWEIEPSRSALLILDMQRGYVCPDWGIGKVIRRTYPYIYDYYYSRLEQTVAPNILRLRESFRRSRLEVFYTRLGFQLPQGRDLPETFWRRTLLRHQSEGERSFLFKESPEYELIEQLQPLPTELVLDRNSLNAFNSTPLDQILKNMGLENLVITGVLTNVAVESTARSGGDRGYNVMVVDDACAAYSRKQHENPLKNVNYYVVKSTDEIIGIFKPCFR